MKTNAGVLVWMEVPWQCQMGVLSHPSQVVSKEEEEALSSMWAVVVMPGKQREQAEPIHAFQDQNLKQRADYVYFQ